MVKSGISMERKLSFESLSGIFGISFFCKSLSPLAGSLQRRRQGTYRFERLAVPDFLVASTQNAQRAQFTLFPCHENQTLSNSNCSGSHHPATSLPHRLAARQVEVKALLMAFHCLDITAAKSESINMSYVPASPCGKCLCRDSNHKLSAGRRCVLLSQCRFYYSKS